MANEPVELLPFGASPLAPQTTYTSPSTKWISDFTTSALSGMTELVGIELEGAAEFRQDNPLAGFASQFAGVGVPYLGWFKATKLIKPLDRAIDAIGQLDKAPFTIGAAREAARFAPFEVGRLGASQVVGDTPFSDMATDVTLSLALGAGVGGLVHGIAAAGTRDAASRTVIPGVNVLAPPSLQLRKLNELIAGNTLAPDVLFAARNRARELDVLVRSEGSAAQLAVPRGKQYVSDVNGSKGLTRGLNGLFNLSRADNTAVQRRRFIQGHATAFPDEASWRGAAAAAGLPENFPELGQFFRQVTFRPTGKTQATADKVRELSEDLFAGKMSSDEYQKIISRLASTDYSRRKARAVDRQITTEMESVGDNWFMAKERDGLFVMARKVTGTPGNGAVGDSWVLFKTDQPGAFVPPAQKWTEMVIAKNSWQPNAGRLPDGGEVYNAAGKWMDTYTPEELDVLSKPGRLEKLLPKKLVGPSNEFAGRLKDGAREFLAPASHQLKKSKLGTWILQTARVATETADMAAHQVVYGRQAMSDKNLFLQALSKGTLETTETSLQDIIMRTSDEAWAEAQDLWRKAVPPEEYSALVQQGLVSQEAADAAMALAQQTDFTFAEMNKLLGAIGETPRKPRKGHLGLGRFWEGDTRIAIRNEAGEITDVAGGKTRKEAQKNAKLLAARGQGLRVAEEKSISQLDSMPLEMRMTVGEPGFLKERQGIGGFKWDLEPWTKREVLEAYQQSMSARYRYMAGKTIEDLLSQPMAQLAATDPVSHRIVGDRIRALRGEQGPFGALQNKFVDKVMAPMLGTNSATKIVSITNTTMHTLHFGMANLSYPIMNLLTFPQTTMPEIAMILNAVPEDLAGRYPELYTWMAVGGSNGLPVGAAGVLSPMKLMASSVREMIRPRADTQAAVARGARESVFAPRVVEEYFGQSASAVTDLRKAETWQDFGRGLLAISNWLPANSEKMARIHTFTAAWLLAKDVLKIADDDVAYMTAKRLTENTMFLYSAADRPKIFTSPVGSAMGLFKTWMMNYLAAMLEYSGQAVKGNWAPLAWQTAGTAAIGGAAATPLYWIADGFSRAFGDKTLLQTTYDNMEEDYADALMFGIPSFLTGISLYSQTSSPLANPARDASMLWSAVTFDRIRGTAKAAGLAFDHWQATGEHPGRSDAVRDMLFKSLAPSTIARSLAAFSGEDMVRSLSTGYPQIENVPLSDRIAYAFKFNPVELDRAMEVQGELFAQKAKRREQIVALGRAFAEAQQERDGEQMMLVLRQAMVWGLDPSSVLRSSANRTERANVPQMQENFKAQDITPFRNVLGR